MILGAQGVFYNAFCTYTYLLFPLVFDLPVNFVYSPVLPALAEDLSPLRRILGGGGRCDLVCVSSTCFVDLALGADIVFALDRNSTRCIEEIEAGRLPAWSVLLSTSTQLLWTFT